MSYSKPIRQCQDAPVGIGEINKLVQNQNEQRTALVVEHQAMEEQLNVATGWGDVGGSGVVFADFRPAGGAHNTPKVARGTLVVMPHTSFAPNSPVFRVPAVSGAVVGVTRLGTGSYFVAVKGLSDFYADVTPAADDTSAARIYTQTPSTDGVTPGIFVSLWESTPIIAGAVPNVGMVLADYGFDVIVYGRTSDSAVPAYVRPGQGRRQSLNPRNHMRPFKFLSHSRRR